MNGSNERGDSQITIRYAPYIENKHSAFLNNVYDHRVAIIDNSPYASCEALDINDAFFSTGYAISNFPSLHDMFGKFMAGLDIEIIWSNAFENTFEKTEINESVAAEMALVDDKITNDLADFQLDMRGINSVVSSSFVVGKAMIENARIKLLSKISLESKLGLVANVQIKVDASLNWAKKAITSYAEFMKAYYQFKPDIDDYNTINVAKDRLWPFTVLDFERAALGALQGTAGYQKTGLKRTRSTISSVFLVASYTATGAYIGSSFGPWGTIVFGVVGFFVGIAMLFLE